jgi:UDP-N-acetylmuramoyl-tripeptide--D-alanyl-D-alanine ligase
VPLTLARLPCSAAFCVVEIGMNHAGEIAPLARLARPHVAVITAIEKAHIGFLGSIEAIADEKASIMAGLEQGGVAVLPVDTPLFPRLRAVADAAGARVVGFGAGVVADVRLAELTMDADGSDVVAVVGGAQVRFRINAPGRHMATNAMAALGVLDNLSREMGEAGLRGAKGVSHFAGEIFRNFSPILGRGARRCITVPGGTALLLDESYNSNPASMRAALSVLALQPAGRRIAVLGDMLELGEAGAAEHAVLAPDVTVAADLVFACGPLMRHLFDALPDRQRATYVPDSSALAPMVVRAVAPGDVILVKGSLASRMRRVVDALDAATAPQGAGEAA